MSSLYIFLLGCIGALAPEFVRLYSIRNNPEQFRWSWFYLFVSIFFALIGGVMAFILPATTYWGAMYIGISTPVLVNSVLKKGLETKQIQFKTMAHRGSLKLSFTASFLKGL